MDLSLFGRDEADEACALYAEACEAMRARGMRQWLWETYPTSELVRDDIRAERMYALREDGRLVAAFALCAEAEEQYAGLSWQYGVKPATLHRLAVAPSRYCGETVERVTELAKAAALRAGCDSLRLDVCCEDAETLALMRRITAREVGEAELEDPTLASICFECPLDAACPMLPIRMRPAYRYGALTPWGGDGLKTMYGKDIPDPRTGEALEVSAISGLESLSDAGEKLTEIIARDSDRLIGKGKTGEFPLLLKLLCSREPLSVQVHPNDAYSRLHEGKLGKSEAWVILSADENAQILYGLNAGVTTDALRAALEAGGDIEPMIARVLVKPGDVFYMPSGMVHAIGGGIVLYEIQQSSDVTYRLWDYNRVNDKGEKRPLHIKQALDVIVPELAGLRAELPSEGGNAAVRLLDVPAFKLDCVCVSGEYELAPHPTGFRIITALKSLLISWQGDALELEAGHSAILPAACPPVTLMGVGRALVAMDY